MRGLKSLNATLRKPKCFLLVVLAAAGAAGGGAWLWLNSHPVRITGTSLEFVTLGKVDPVLVERIARETAQAYQVPFRVGRSASLPMGAYLADRGQYESDRMLDLLPAPEGPRAQRLYITEADITYSNMSFLFGLSRPEKRTAVLSLAHFQRKPARSQAELEALSGRAVKIAVHELGHSYGFQHCAETRCVMHYSDTVGGVDESGLAFCGRCRKRLRQGAP